MSVRHTISNYAVSEVEAKFRSVVGLDVFDLKRKICTSSLEKENASPTICFFGKSRKPISGVHIKSGIHIYTLTVLVYEVDGVHLNQHSSHGRLRSWWVDPDLLPGTPLLQKTVS